MIIFHLELMLLGLRPALASTDPPRPRVESRLGQGDKRVKLIHSQDNRQRVDGAVLYRKRALHFHSMDQVFQSAVVPNAYLCTV